MTAAYSSSGTSRTADISFDIEMGGLYDQVGPRFGTCTRLGGTVSDDVQVTLEGEGIKRFNFSRLQLYDSGREKRPRRDVDSELARKVGGIIVDHLGNQPFRSEWEIMEDRLRVRQCYGVDGQPFGWDEDVDGWQQSRDSEGTVWTLQWAKEAWNGATTPLHYSIIARELQEAHEQLRLNIGESDLAEARLFKYYQARAYYNTSVDAAHASLIVPRGSRGSHISNVHPDDRGEVLSAPFSWGKLIRVIVRQLLHKESRPFTWIDLSYEYMHDNADNAGLPTERLRNLTDRELINYIESRVERSSKFNAQMWLGFYTYGTWAFIGLSSLLRSWLNQDGRQAKSLMQKLISGLPSPEPIQARERQRLWELSDKIRQSAGLTQLLMVTESTTFFARCSEFEEGRQFLADYRSFIDEFGDRGSEDRDIYHRRRGEDPSIDYRALKLIVEEGRTNTPDKLTKENRQRREEVTEKVVEELESQRFGWLKKKAFLALLSYVHRFLRLRDDQRHTYDLMGMSKKRGLQEIARRLLERNRIGSITDVYFLSWQELQQLFVGSPNEGLYHAKIAGRRERFEQVYRRENPQPLYLLGNAILEYERSRWDGETLGVGETQRGTGNSPGVVTGRVRLIPNLRAMGRLKRGDILVCTNTDPGWAAAFFVAGGIILEEGGILAPGACMAREHGIPSITLQGAMSRMVEGSLVRMNGSEGIIECIDEG